MKYIKLSIFLCLSCFLFPVVLNAQDKLDIKISVLDQNNLPLTNAVVTPKNTRDVVTLDTNGVFTVKTDEGALVTIEAAGYKTKVFSVRDGLNEIQLDRNELVNVPLKSIEKTDVVGAVSHVNVPELLEKNYYTGSLDNMQAYVPGFNGNIWGNGSMLIVVDGVPRDAANVLPTEIEQITFLKGVSALALYGSKAARGAVIINTKRGVEAVNHISVRANTGIRVPKLYPNYLGSAEYMDLYNEARLNDELGVLFDETEIDNYRSGHNPYRYPDIDYYSSEYLRSFSNSSNVTTELSGGTDRARYYTNIGFSHNNSLLNVGQSKHDAETRLNIRGNIDMDINKYITSRVNATMVFYNNKGAQGNYWGNAANLRPHRYTPLIPISYFKGEIDGDQEALDEFVDASPFLIDGKYLLGGNIDHQTNPFAEMYTKGSNTYSSRNFQFDAAVDIDLGSVTKGLGFSAQFGIDYLTRFNLSVNNNDYAVYEANWWEDAEGYEYIFSLNQHNIDKVSRGRNLSGSYLRQSAFFTAGFNYANTFGDGHNVSGILNFMGNREAVSEVYHKTAAANMGIQAAYNYKHRYYADFTGNVVHSAKFAKGARQAFSPTVTLAWRPTAEDFLADSDILTDMKIHATAGILNTDLDFNDYYMYTEVYRRTGWTSWNEGHARDATYLTRGGNANLTFVERKEINVGLDASLLRNKFLLSATYFYSVMDGLPIQNANLYPSYFRHGSTDMIPYDNYNADLRTGFDVGITYNQQIDQVGLSFGLNALYYDTKALKRSEIYEFENQKTEGNPSDAIYGMRSLGLYRDEQEILDHDVTHALGAVKPGDIKYVDITGDGIIDGKDTEYLGRWSAPLSFGANLTLRWKGFTFFALATGNFGGYGTKTNDYYWVYGDRKYSEVVRDRAILAIDDETGQTFVSNYSSALYPRLTSGSSSNNFRSSDYWLYKTDRINLSKVQLTYDLPRHLFNNTIINGISAYVSGSNLLVISKERKLMEMNIGGGPQTRFYNLGFNVLF